MTIQKTIFRQLKDQGEIFTDSIFLNYKELKWSFKETEITSKRLMNHFKIKFNFKNRETIALLCGNRAEFIFTLFASLGLGNKIVLINTALSSREVLYILKNAEVSKIIIEDELFEKHKDILAEWGQTTIKISPEWLILNDVPFVEESKMDNGINPHDTAIIIYTSGTTGFPKGVELSHSNILNEAMLFAETMNYSGELREKHLCFLPLYHVFSLLISFFGHFMAGNEIFLIEKFNLDFWNIISQNRITSFTTVPTVLNILVNKSDPDVDISSLDYCISGAASLPVETLTNFQKRFKCNVREGYGLSEGTCAASVNPRDGPIKIGSIGKAINEIELGIIDKNRKFLKRGEIGSLCISGPIVMKGYYNDKEATDTVIWLEDNKMWLNTGDLAYIDEDGYVFLKGRSKELIITKAENVYPKELELVINSVEGVQESAAVGLKHEIYGEIPVIFYVGKDTNSDELYSKAKKELATFKIPKHFIKINQLPKNSLSKIQKHILANIASKLFPDKFVKDHEYNLEQLTGE